jgi:hypothetical protein
MVASLTTTPAHRKSSKEAQAVQRDEKLYDDDLKSAFKVSTVLWDTVQSDENTLSQFCLAEKCAELTNRVFGIELVSSYLLKQGLKKWLRQVTSETWAINQDPYRQDRCTGFFMFYVQVN